MINGNVDLTQFIDPADLITEETEASTKEYADVFMKLLHQPVQMLNALYNDECDYFLYLPFYEFKQISHTQIAEMLILPLNENYFELLDKFLMQVVHRYYRRLYEHEDKIVMEYYERMLVLQIFLGASKLGNSVGAAFAGRRAASAAFLMYFMECVEDFMTTTTVKQAHNTVNDADCPAIKIANKAYQFIYRVHAELIRVYQNAQDNTLEEIQVQLLDFIHQVKEYRSQLLNAVVLSSGIIRMVGDVAETCLKMADDMSKYFHQPVREPPANADNLIVDGFWDETPAKKDEAQDDDNESAVSTVTLLEELNQASSSSSGCEAS